MWWKKNLKVKRNTVFKRVSIFLLSSTWNGLFGMGLQVRRHFRKIIVKFFFFVRLSMREQSENVAMGAFGAGHFTSIIVNRLMLLYFSFQPKMSLFFKIKNNLFLIWSSVLTFKRLKITMSIKTKFL